VNLDVFGREFHAAVFETHIRPPRELLTTQGVSVRLFSDSGEMVFGTREGGQGQLDLRPSSVSSQCHGGPQRIAAGLAGAFRWAGARRPRRGSFGAG
jgi:hypothetical protein